VLGEGEEVVREAGGVVGDKQHNDYQRKIKKQVLGFQSLVSVLEFGDKAETSSTDGDSPEGPQRALGMALVHRCLTE
jgi:hypothetical protein